MDWPIEVRDGYLAQTMTRLNSALLGKFKWEILFKEEGGVERES